MKKGKIYVNKKDNIIKGPCGVTLKNYPLSQIKGANKKSLDNFYSDMSYSSDKFYTEITEQFLCFVNGVLLAAVQLLIKSINSTIPIELSYKTIDSLGNKKRFTLSEDLKDSIDNPSISELLIIELAKLKIEKNRLKEIFPLDYIKLVPQIVFFGLWQRILSEDNSNSLLYCSADNLSKTLNILYEKKLGFSNRGLIYYVDGSSPKAFTLYRYKCEKEIINGHLSLRNNVYLKDFFNSYEIIEL